MELLQLNAAPVVMASRGMPWHAMACHGMTDGIMQLQRQLLQWDGTPAVTPAVMACHGMPWHATVARHGRK